ncbi:MAG: patatin-like phospholipase family protein [Peptococcaceae bacterium]|nr:patatin-like phospholipase family protein [Peptococcaceae bacterium]
MCKKVAMLVSRAPREEIKDEIRALLAEGRVDEAAGLAVRKRSNIRYLNRLLYHPDELVRRRAIEGMGAVADRLAPTRSLLGRDDFNILALSGGASGGAFGAGALVGLTRSGRRPDFAIVTGVSTGALIAPLAFLGSEWDERLADAYVGGHAADLLSIRGFAGALGTGLFKGEGLEALIAPIIDERLMDAVAAEHARGRRLLIATTNLDSQKATIWDMGAIASRGGEAALKLFREVMLASASVPGLFPPRLFDVEAGGERFQEMHVDGGVAAPR